MPTSLSDLQQLLEEARQADAVLSDLQAQAGAAREKATQAWARYKQAADTYQLSLDFEEVP